MPPLDQTWVKHEWLSAPAQDSLPVRPPSTSSQSDLAPVHCTRPSCSALRLKHSSSVYGRFYIEHGQGLCAYTNHLVYWTMYQSVWTRTLFNAILWSDRLDYLEMDATRHWSLWNGVCNLFSIHSQTNRPQGRPLWIYVCVCSLQLKKYSWYFIVINILNHHKYVSLNSKLWGISDNMSVHSQTASYVAKH
jgi:hypothetical protein